VLFCNAGRAMARAVNWRPQTAEDRFQPQTSPWEIYGRQSGTETGFPPSTSGTFPWQYHYTNIYFMEY
jgi:hypothetical protein